MANRPAAFSAPHEHSAVAESGAKSRRPRSQGPHAAIPLTQRRLPSPTATLLVAACGTALVFLDSAMITIAFPALQRDFHGDINHLSWVLNAYNIALAAFLAVGAGLAELLGRRRVFIYGALVFTVASGLCAAADTFGQLIALRALQGLGAGLLLPASLAQVIKGFDAAHRARGLVVCSATAAVASGLGSVIGGAVVDASTWRWVFMVNLPLGAAAVAVAQRAVIESRSSTPQRMPDLGSAALFAIALSGLTLGLVTGRDPGWRGPVIAAALVVVATLGLVVRSRRRPTPLIDPALRRTRPFGVGAVLALIAGVGLYASALTHVLFLNRVWDYTLLQAGLAVAPAAVAAAAIAAALARFTARHGHRFIVGAGALIWAGSLLWYIQVVGPHPEFLREWLPGQILQGVGTGAMLSVLAGNALARVVAEADLAGAAAVVGTARQVGAVLGIALLVVVVAVPGHNAAADETLRRGWMVAAASAVLVAIGAALLGRVRETATGPADIEAPPDVALPAPTPSTPYAPVELTGPITIGEVDLLKAMPLFAGLDPAALAELRAHAEDVDLRAGSYLFHAGDPSDSFYVVRNGRIQVVQNEVVLRELGRGEVVGELGFLIDAPRSAAIRAVRDSTLLRLTKADFDRIADAGVLTALTRVLATRLHENPAPLAPHAPTPEAVIAVVGVDAHAPVPMVTAELVETLSGWLRVVHPGRIDRDGLERAERRADKVILQATTEDPDWRDFCLRSADRVVLVTADPAPPAAPLPARATGADLVFAGPPADREHRRSWEELITPRSVHAVRSTYAGADLRPLAARIAGRSVGLVLSGGAARAYAHLGVLDELEAAGVVVDRYAGTSMGAVIAAMAATGVNAEAVDAHVYEYFVRSNPTSDYTLPRKSLIRGQRTMAGLHSAFRGLFVEDLPKEFRCVSVDLLARRAVVHRTGPVAEVVGCSLRVPGLFAPAVYGGSLHVDGGVLDNLPVDALAGPEGPVIAVSVSPEQPAHAGATADRAAIPQVPNVVDTIIRTMTIGNAMASSAALARADLAIHPDTTSIGFLEWHQIDRAREIGRMATRAVMPQILDLVHR